MAWSLWSISPRGAGPLPLPASGELLVGARVAGAGRLEAEGLAAEHLRFRARDGELEVEALASALLNDVQLKGRSRLQPGDELLLGEARLLVLEHRAHPAPELRSRRVHETFREGLFLGPGPASVLFAKLPSVKQRPTLLAQLAAALPEGASASELGASTLEVVLPPGASRDACGMRLVAAGAERVQGATRRKGAETLDDVLERAFCRFLNVRAGPPEDAAHADPTMLRVVAALERLPADASEWTLVGERGVGKESLARVVHHRLDPKGPFVALLPVEGPDAVARVASEAKAGTLFIDLGPAALDARAFDAWRRAAAPARRVCWSVVAEPPGAIWVFPVPPLRDRPRDVLPLAEAALARYGPAAGRPSLTLADSTVEALVAATFPGNVRALANAMAHAALASPAPEIAVESLPCAVQDAAGESGPLESLRDTLDAREREALLATLARTRWNVTRAAEALGIPRRTVVYRMARLGLRRPEKE